tara:strand:- start:1004 stop:1549 length:546 start_codon:yes stop_codon:yes gene_type:complete
MIKILSFIILVCILPIMSIIAIFIIIDDGFPVLFKQKRIGRDNCIFLIYKFRTMKKGTPDIPTHLVEKSQNIFTWCGPFLRKYSLDELPQLLNVLKGDMVFIGPRPSLHNQDDLISLRKSKGVQKLKPGITGWAQVNGRDRLTISEKVEMDVYYKNHKSVLLDLKIIWMSIIKVFKSEDVV